MPTELGRQRSTTLWSLTKWARRASPTATQVTNGTARLTVPSVDLHEVIAIDR